MIKNVREPFSVLLSVYAKDDPAWLKEALNSVLLQSVPPNEVVVMCDGPLSPALNKTLAAFGAQITIHRLNTNSGLGEALRRGVVECRYELVARMDADDISLPDRFEKQLRQFTQTPDLAICGGFIQEISPDKAPLSVRKVPLTDGKIKNFLKYRSPFNHMSVMFRKSAVLAVGNYQSFHFLEDYYLWARMAEAGLRMVNLPDILIYARTGKDMISRRGGWKYFKSNKALYAKMRQMHLLTWEQFLYILTVRFCVQVLMPNKMRGFFYKKALR